MDNMIQNLLRTTVVLSLAAGCGRPSQGPPLESSSGWPFRTNGEIFSIPCVDTKHFYVGSCNGAFYCVDKHTGRPVWKDKEADYLYANPVIHNDLVVYASHRRKLHAVARQDGTPTWSRAVPTGTFRLGLWRQHIVYSGKNELGVSLAATGNVVETYHFKGDGAAFAVGDQQVVVVVNSDSKRRNYTGAGRLVSFNRGVAQSAWELDLQASCRGAMIRDDANCYLGTRDGIFYAIRLTDGAIVWQIDCRQLFPSRVPQSGGYSNPVWADGYVLDLGDEIAFSVSHQNIQTPAALVIVDKDSGDVLHVATHPQQICGVFALYGSHLVAATEDRKLLLMDRNTGGARVLSCLPPGTRGEFAGVKIDGDILYLAGADGCIHRLDMMQLLKKESSQPNGAITQVSAPSAAP